MHTFRLLLSLLLLALLPTSALALRLHDGDLLFVTAARTGLSGAIDDATATQGAPSFDHVGLVAHDGRARVVLHADEEGSRQQPLADFIQQARAKQRQIFVYRLNAAQRAAIPDAIAQARQTLQPDLRAGRQQLLLLGLHRARLPRASGLCAAADELQESAERADVRVLDSVLPQQGHGRATRPAWHQPQRYGARTSVTGAWATGLS